MRFRLFLILIGVVVLSLASGLGLRYALAWVEPGAAPPDGNVPKPINVGADSQTKTGDLIIGGDFSVGRGQIVGVPAGGNMGVGTLNAEQLCIQGNCRLNWPEAVNAFVDEGNVGFGPTAVLGTNDNVPLSFETNGVGRVQIDAAGNVGIGTTNTAYNLMVGGVAPRIYFLPAPGSNSELDFGSPAMDTHWAIYRDSATDQLRFWRAGAGETNRVVITNNGNIGVGTTNPLYKLTITGTAPREYLWPSGGGNPELDFGNVAGDTHWAIYRDLVSDELRFWRNNDRLIITSDGSVGVGTNPAYKLDVAGQINASTNLTPAIQGVSSAGDGQGVYGAATNAVGANYGGYFESAGDSGVGVYGLSSNIAGSGAGGVFQADGVGSVGVYGITNSQGSFGLYGLASGESSTAVSGTASSLVGNNKGGSFFAGNASIVTGGDNNIGVMAAGGGSAGKNYGGYFKAQGAGYGVYSVVTDAAAWSGYFTGGKGVYTDAEVVGAAGGGYKGAGTLNAEQICIQGNCLAAWPAGVAPGGVAGQIQFNDGGVFAGDAGLIYDKATDALTLGGNLKVGVAAAGNDDYIYFDDGSKYLQWQDMMSRFSLSNSLFVEGQMTGTGGITTISGSWISASDPTNQKNIRIRHDGVNGILDTNSAGVISPGNLVLMAPYLGTIVQVQDDLNVTGILTVDGNATVLGRNICLQDGTNCPVGAGVHIIYRCNDGAANEGRLIADYGGSEAKVFCGGAGTYSDTGLRAQ